MPLHPRTCSALYSFSCILDAADGLAARCYNQSTTFGAVLDMVTDRCTTTCLLVFLASAFPRWSIIFQGLISLDLASHYVHMFASLTTGGQSHKKVEASRSWVLHLYYTNKVGILSPESMGRAQLADKILGSDRRSSSFSAPSTNSSSSPYTSSPSPRRSSPPPSSSPATKAVPPPHSLVPRRIRNPVLSS